VCEIKITQLFPLCFKKNCFLGIFASFESFSIFPERGERKEKLLAKEHKCEKKISFV
jgi:hypothetical protein